MDITQPFLQSKQVQEYLNHHHIFPYVRRSNKDRDFQLQWHDKGLENGVKPIEYWKSIISDLLPHAIISDCKEQRAHWRVGNPVLIASMWIKLPKCEFMIYAIIIMQMNQIILERVTLIALLMTQLHHIIRHRLVFLTIKFWAFIKKWNAMIEHLVKTPKLETTKALVIYEDKPITQAIRKHGKKLTLQALKHLHREQGITAMQNHLEQNPQLKIPTWDDLPTKTIIVNL